MSRTHHEELIELAERQHSLISRPDTLEIGLSKHAWSRLRRSPDWEPLSGLVVRRRGAAVTDSQRALAAVLDAGPRAAVCRRTAAAMWEVPGFTVGDTIHVVRARGITSRPSALAVVHTDTRFSRDHLRDVDGVPVTSPAQTVVDLARELSTRRLAAVVDGLWARRLLCGDDLHDALGDVAMSGRDGVTSMREVLETRGRSYVPPASGLERRFEEVLDGAGEPPMRRQVDSGGDRWVGRVDYRDAELPLIAEINSQRYHASLCDQAADAARYEALRTAGFRVEVFWDTEVFHDPKEVVRRIREARAALRAARRAA